MGVTFPRRRQLARLGEELEPGCPRAIAMDAVLFLQWAKCGRDLPPFAISRQNVYRWKRRFDRHDVTTLEGRSHRPRGVRQTTWAPQLAERGFVSAQAVSALGQGQAGRAARPARSAASPPPWWDASWSIGSGAGYFTNRPSRPCCARRAEIAKTALGAIRKPKYWRVEQPGDLVEIDTKEIRMRRGVLLKHFSARDVVSRWDVVEVHHRATSLAAARFLETLLERFAPFRKSLARWMAEASSPPSSRKPASKNSWPLFVSSAQITRS